MGNEQWRTQDLQTGERKLRVFQVFEMAVLVPLVKPQICKEVAYNLWELLTGPVEEGD